MKANISNHQIVTLAVYLLGGATRPVDTEDVAIKADELAPGKYRWRKYQEQINMELVRTFLSDAKKKKNGALVEGTGNRGWQLTQEGLKLAKALKRKVKKADLSGEAISPKEKAWRKTERIRLMNSSAYLTFSLGGISKVTRQEAEAFFRLNDYILGESRVRKVNRVQNAFSEDAELGRAVKLFAEIALKESK